MCVGIYVLVDRYWELGVQIYLYVLGNVVWGGKLQKKKEYKKFLFFCHLWVCCCCIVCSVLHVLDVCSFYATAAASVCLLHLLNNVFCKNIYIYISLF